MSSASTALTLFKDTTVGHQRSQYHLKAGILNYSENSLSGCLASFCDNKVHVNNYVAAMLPL